MTLKEILEIAITYLGLDDELKLSGCCITPGTDKELISLVKCANIIYGELASDYFPLTKELEMSFSDNKVYYSNIPDRIIDVVSVKDMEGNSVTFRLFPQYLVAKLDRGIVTYCYLPSTIGIEDEVGFGIKVSARLFALGICAEYCFINSKYDEGVCFDKKYRQGIKSALVVKGARTIKARRW